MRLSDWDLYIIDIKQYETNFINQSNIIIIKSLMQFTQMMELESLKQDSLDEILSKKLPQQPQEIIAIEPKNTPTQYYTILNEIQEINHSRSMAHSLIEPMLGDTGGIVQKINPFSEENLNTQKEDNERFEEIDFTPSMLRENSTRKSNMFTSTRSGDSQNLTKSSEKNEGLKIYYFGQQIYKYIQFQSNATIDTVIGKALNAYQEDLSLDQTYVVSNDYKKYELRFVEEDGSFIPDYSVQPVARERMIADSIFEVLVLVLKDKHTKLESSQKKCTKSGAFTDSVKLINAGQVKLNIFNEANMHVSSIILSKQDTLQKAIQFLQQQLKQKIVLVENLTDQYSLPEDFDVKNLSTFKLYAKKKKFQDEPQRERIPIKVISSIPKDLSKKVLSPIGITQASRYEQFQVIKINSHGFQQPRILGIDQTKIYNYDPTIRKANKEASFLSIAIGNNPLTGTKKPQRLISDILGINNLEDLNFEILFPEKKTTFIAQSEQKKSRIIRKLKFLIDFNKQQILKI